MLEPLPTEECRTTMTDSEPRAQAETVEDDERRLKYLEFVEIAAIYAAACCSSLYELAKENAGPLLPGVQVIEDTVRAVISPVWERYQDVPLELLRFIDHKVDEYVHELESHMPSLVKQVSGQARAVAEEARRARAMDAVVGFARDAIETYKPVAKELYLRYEPLAEEYAVWTWRHLNQLPLFPEVAHVVVPTAAYWAERYNDKLCCAAERGYTVAGYLPSIPIDTIAEIFEEAEAEGGGEVSVPGNTAGT